MSIRKWVDSMADETAWPWLWKLLVIVSSIATLTITYKLLAS